ncbi:hypothetical protein BDQ94DRAFT_171724 [Aspergillus welwitschiae]|uniref:Uncharacterized protein n=1 Tax=Aspergillus welwitschiae TaxID=1341132 RepID=A0A3F3PZ47_9EURO|nr:hypothetical protein BDQ94DRAFT_171724 [Aspergillus welwitschiae]RDH31646.1 hypothetical protein BDQ94DRAFT_171724 [Aspergillus welwitschiae]
MAYSPSYLALTIASNHSLSILANISSAVSPPPSSSPYSSSSLISPSSTSSTSFSLTTPFPLLFFKDPEGNISSHPLRPINLPNLLLFTSNPTSSSRTYPFAPPPSLLIHGCTILTGYQNVPRTGGST